MEPAAPYPEPGAALPKYNANAAFPILKSIEVIMAPVHTVLHLTFASGKNLNISANNTVIIDSEIIRLRILNIINKDSDQCRKTHELIADNKDDTTREINNKKAMDTINPKEKIRVFTNDHIPDLAFVAFTSQIAFNIF